MAYAVHCSEFNMFTSAGCCTLPLMMAAVVAAEHMSCL
jgi:aspartyl-tRNA synthetase